MSARKKIDIQENKSRVALLSDYGELPEYNVDEYADRLTVARRKFDRLCRFSLGEHEASSLESDDDPISWRMEGKRREEILDRWQKETFAVLTELLNLLHEVRHDATVLDIFLLERSTSRGVASKRKRYDADN
ncbi:hypothetical protein V1289_005220 [Bradyrhizobium sp. AZCC 2289]